MFRRRKPSTDDTERLGELEVFAGLGENALTAVLEASELVNEEPGTTLVEEGAHSHHFYVVVDGDLEVTLDGEHLATLGRGDVVGEAALLDWWKPSKADQERFASGRRTATVSVSEDGPVELLVMEPRDFEQLRSSAPAAAERLIESVRSRSREAQQD